MKNLETPGKTGRVGRYGERRVMGDDQDGGWRVKHVEILTVQNLRV